MAQIRKTIKINVDSDIANTKLRQIKSSVQSIPSQMNVNTKNFVRSIGEITIALTLAKKAMDLFKDAFTGLVQDQHSIHRIQNAIRVTGSAARLSAQGLTQ